MNRDRRHFSDLMLEAQRGMLVLDGVTKRDGSKAASAAVNDGKSIYEQLLACQRTVWMTKAEAATLQTAMDLIQARLKFFDELV